jgi:hypothetical protein
MSLGRRVVMGGAMVAALLPVMAGAAHADTVVGDNGDNHLLGTAGADTIRAKGGDDVARGLAGNDRINGGRGSDVLWGDAGRDVLDVGRDSRVDRAHGGIGADTLYIFGRDRGWGSGGNDRIYGTYAQHGMEIWCGAGEDRVVYNQPSPTVVLHGCEHVRVISAG